MLAFISIREASKILFINPRTLVKKLNSGIPFIGYYYYYKPLVVKKNKSYLIIINTLQMPLNY
jgi:hypothetical protein